MRKEFGFMGKDKVTGFEGYITGYCEYMYGCGQFLLTPTVKDDNTKQEGHWIDEGRIEILPDIEPVNIENVQSEEKGGPQDHPSCQIVGDRMKRMLQAIKDKDIKWTDLKGATITNVDVLEKDLFQLTIAISTCEGCEAAPYSWTLRYTSGD